MLNRFLRRIWADVSHGENLDAYAIIAAAIGLSVAGAFGYSNPNILAGVTLAILTLITISSLVTRHRIEDLTERLSPSAASMFLSDFPPSIKDDIETASELWLIGASLDDVVDSFSTFERKLRQDHTIRVLVMNPSNDSVLEISDMRAYANPNPLRARQKIEASLDDFCVLQRLAPDNLLIRVIDFPVSQRMVVSSFG